MATWMGTRGAPSPPKRTCSLVSWSVAPTKRRWGRSSKRSIMPGLVSWRSRQGRRLLGVRVGGAREEGGGEILEAIDHAGLGELALEPAAQAVAREEARGRQ